jgi:hypothetical protein
MPAVDQETLDRWRELVVVDRDGAAVGTISEFYLDRDSRQPTWALIDSGLLGTRQSFVPLATAVEAASALRVPYAKQQIRTAPGIDPDGELTPQEEATLFAHYGMNYEAVTGEPPRRLTRRTQTSPQ